MLLVVVLQDSKAALDWLAAFHALWWEEVRSCCQHAHVSNAPVCESCGCCTKPVALNSHRRSNEQLAKPAQLL
jgi:hypothetical protein